MGGSRYQFTQEFQLLPCQFVIEKVDTCEITARTGEAGDETGCNRA